MKTNMIKINIKKVSGSIARYTIEMNRTVVGVSPIKYREETTLTMYNKLQRICKYDKDKNITLAGVLLGRLQGRNYAKHSGSIAM